MSKLVFVCGFPSGGTDLLRTVLNVHPDIYISVEMPWLKGIVGYGYDRTTTFSDIDSIHAFQSLLKKLDRWHAVRNLSYDFTPDLQEKGSLSLEEVLRTCCLERSAEVWGNKTPQNTENIDVLSELFPEAHFLIVTRDVRDVCLSWKNKWGKDMIWCAAKWAERMAKGRRVTEKLSPNRCLYVKFEDLISDTEEICVRICRFLELPFSRRMLEHHKYMREQIGGKVNYGKPIKAGNLGKWKTGLSTETIKRIEEIAYPTMQLLGYPVKYATGRRPISLLETWLGKWHDGWAMLMVGNRYNKRNSFLRRLRVVRNQLYWRFME
jgi:hypothetical protein